MNTIHLIDGTSVLDVVKITFGDHEITVRSLTSSEDIIIEYADINFIQ